MFIFLQMPYSGSSSNNQPFIRQPPNYWPAELYHPVVGSSHPQDLLYDPVSSFRLAVCSIWLPAQMTSSPMSLYVRNWYPGAYLSQIEENGFHVRNCWHSLFILRDNRNGSFTTSKGMPSLVVLFSSIRVSNQIFMIYPFDSCMSGGSVLRCLGDFIKARLRLRMLSGLASSSFRSCHQSVLETGFPFAARTVLPSGMCDACKGFRWRGGLRSFLPAGFLLCLPCPSWSFLFAAGLYGELSFGQWVAGG